MSLQVAKELHCDGCGEWMRLEYDLMRYHWSELKKDGWTREKGKHFCPKCGLNGSYENHEDTESPFWETIN
tara:strand:- start:46 stop:258 length:213 start_codon:yes stop_codon:yes gene_type:complete